RLGADQRRRGGGLNEDVVGRIVAIDLDDVAEGDAAAGVRRRRVAAQFRSYLPDRGRQIVAFRRDAIVEPARLQPRELVRLPPLIACANLARSPRHHAETMNSTYWTFSAS